MHNILRFLTRSNSSTCSRYSSRLESKEGFFIGTKIFPITEQQQTACTNLESVLKATTLQQPPTEATKLTRTP